MNKKESYKISNHCKKCGIDLVESDFCRVLFYEDDCRGIILSQETLKEWDTKKTIQIGPFSPRIAKIFQDELNKEKNRKL